MLVIDENEHAATVLLRKALLERSVAVFNPADITPENAPSVIAVYTTCTRPVEDFLQEVCADDGHEPPAWLPKAGRCLVTTQFSGKYFAQSKERIIAKLLSLMKSPILSEESTDWMRVQEKTGWM